MAEIAEALAQVKARIAEAERAAGRTPGSVRLVAVSKTKPAAAIEEAYAAGHRDFGESYAQELDRKARDLAHLEGIRWHFIGNLQRNKAKVVATHAHVLHTLDTAGLAGELQKRLTQEGRRLEALVEVNVSGEPQKHGLAPEALGDLLEACRGLDRLDVRGLMTVPPADDGLAAEQCFRALASLRARHSALLRDDALLSMGMSDDLEIAIACGATHVRVGTAIFGARDYGLPAPAAEPSGERGP